MTEPLAVLDGTAAYLPIGPKGGRVVQLLTCGVGAPAGVQQPGRLLTCGPECL